MSWPQKIGAAVALWCALSLLFCTLAWPRVARRLRRVNRDIVEPPEESAYPRRVMLVFTKHAYQRLLERGRGRADLVGDEYSLDLGCMDTGGYYRVLSCTRRANGSVDVELGMVDVASMRVVP